MDRADRRKLVILGSTGSVGRNALEVVRAMPQRFQVVGLCAGSQWRALAGQIREFTPQVAALADVRCVDRLLEAIRGCATQVLAGDEGVCELAGWPGVDVVLSAISGGIGLPAAVRALQRGRTLALANKEALVMAGEFILELAARHGAQIIPVDSEHSAIFQAMRSGDRTEVAQVIITASGGPCYGMSEEELRNVTPAQVLDHPTWDMGTKVTVDSATMMNKALEIIEAHWLFGLSPDKIRVLIHPQSVVHAMVEFVDGSVVAQLAVPDMKLPIQFALTHPERVEGPVQRLSLEQVAQLEFRAAPMEQFPALALGYRVARTGGTSGAVLNAADEVAVGAFLAGRIRFTDIVCGVQKVLDANQFGDAATLEDIMAADRWAREEAERCLRRSSALH